MSLKTWPSPRHLGADRRGVGKDEGDDGAAAPDVISWISDQAWPDPRTSPRRGASVSLLEHPGYERADSDPECAPDGRIARKVHPEMHPRQGDSRSQRVRHRSRLRVEERQGRRRGERRGRVAGWKRMVGRPDAYDIGLAVDKGPLTAEQGLYPHLHHIGRRERCHRGRGPRPPAYWAA